MKHSGDSHKSNLKPTDDKKPTTSTLPKSGEDKIDALKNYRRSKGLCFKCGEKWGPQHKCPAIVSLNAMEQLWSCVTDGEELDFLSAEVEPNSDDELMHYQFRLSVVLKEIKQSDSRVISKAKKYLC